MGKDKFRDGCRVSDTADHYQQFMYITCFWWFVIALLLFYQKYLKDYYFKNAKTVNFWDSLASVSLSFIFS